MNDTSEKAFLGIGWSFPPSFDAQGELSMAAYEEDVRQAIRIILSTNHNERVMRPDFGANMRTLLFEPMSTTTMSLAQHYVERALIEWEPRIDLEEVRVRFDHDASRQNAERSLDHAHILVGNEAGDAGVVHQGLHIGDDHGVVCADELDHDAFFADAIEDAKANAELNKIQHAEFFTGDVIKICDDAFFATHGKPDVIITDPPRAGMHDKLVKKILEIAAPTVVYVSCNPATQARDLRSLDEKYAVTKVQPVDMFPHTHHIENVVQLKLK